MRIIVFVLAFGFSLSIHAKEWKSTVQYQKTTHNNQLSSSDWLTSDRNKNTLVWQKANAFNLTNNRPQEYQSIKQRRDFYVWIDHEFKIKGHEVIWQRMAYYISCKLHLLETFPQCMLSSKQVKDYARQGSEVVFNNTFERLRDLFNSETVLKQHEALSWDTSLLYDEQYIWVEGIYRSIDEKSLKQIERMASGKFLYALVVPKAIRFKGDLSKPEERYRYAVNILRVYCLKRFR
ncbi:Insecticidal toxin complex protein [Flavobacteriaceae bacterium LMO-SS05]